MHRHCLLYSLSFVSKKFDKWHFFQPWFSFKNSRWDMWRSLSQSDLSQPTWYHITATRWNKSVSWLFLCLQEGFKTKEHLRPSFCFSVWLSAEGSGGATAHRPLVHWLWSDKIATLLLVTLIMKVTLLCGDYRLQHSIELSVYGLENIIGTKDLGDGRPRSQTCTLLQLHGFIQTQHSQGMKPFVQRERERKKIASCWFWFEIS